jgi:hypothetical protein
MVNLIQATLVVFIVEDTKNVFRKRAATSNNASKQSSSNGGHHQQSQHGNDYNNSIVSYADGVAATQVNRLPSYQAQQPWSLTMRAPSAMPETIPVHYSPTREGPSSNFYDFGPADQKPSSSPNRHWDIDTESQDTTDKGSRWKNNQAEDEIPMTLAKSREDAHTRHFV